MFINPKADEFLKSIIELSKQKEGMTVRPELDPLQGEKIVVEYEGKTIEFLCFSDIGLSFANKELALGGKSIEVGGVINTPTDSFNFYVEKGQFKTIKFRTNIPAPTLRPAPPVISVSNYKFFGQVLAESFRGGMKAYDTVDQKHTLESIIDSI